MTLATSISTQLAILLLARTPMQLAAPDRPDVPTADFCLTLCNAAGLHRSGPGMGNADFGSIDSIVDPHPTRAFVVRNEQGRPMRLTGAKGSCGCESVLLTRHGKTDREIVLGKGEEATVHVVLDARRLAGTFRLSTWVYAVGSTRPVVTIELSGRTLELVQFTPKYLYFGQVPYGAARSLPFTVSVDAAAVPGGLPELVCGYSAVGLRANGPARTGLRDGRPTLERSYLADLSQTAPGGPISGTVTFREHRPVTASVKPTLLPASNLPSVNLPVSGNVAGGLTASPAIVLFGSIPAGRPASRTVVLSSPSIDELRRLTVSSSSPYVTATLSGSGNSRRILTLTVTTGAPAGPLQAQICVGAPSPGPSLTVTAVGEVRR